MVKGCRDQKFLFFIPGLHKKFLEVVHFDCAGGAKKHLNTWSLIDADGLKFYIR